MKRRLEIEEETRAKGRRGSQVGRRLRRKETMRIERENESLERRRGLED